jgi:putative endonuclease
MSGGYVYIVTNKPNGILYIGVTSDLVRRTYEHREGAIQGFTKRHELKHLVWFERYDDIRTAIQRVIAAIQIGTISTTNCCKDVDGRDKPGHDELNSVHLNKTPGYP